MQRRDWLFERNACNISACHAISSAVDRLNGKDAFIDKDDAFAHLLSLKNLQPGLKEEILKLHKEDLRLEVLLRDDLILNSSAAVISFKSSASKLETCMISHQLRRLLLET